MSIPPMPPPARQIHSFPLDTVSARTDPLPLLDAIDQVSQKRKIPVNTRNFDIDMQNAVTHQTVDLAVAKYISFISIMTQKSSLIIQCSLPGIFYYFLLNGHVL